MKTTGYFFTILLLIFGGSTDGSRILLFHPSPSKSNLIYSVPLARALADQGHQVTVVTPFEIQPKYEGENYREIVQPIKGFDEDTKKVMQSGNKTIDPLLMFKMAKMLNETYTIILTNPEFRKIMQTETFDLIIFGFLFVHFYYGLAAHFNCPYIIISPQGAASSSNELVGDHYYPATVPHIFLDYAEPMTFKQRLFNLLIDMTEPVLTGIVEYQNKALYEHHFPTDKYPTYEQMKLNCSLVFINKHFSQGVIRPSLPTVVEVGGLQIGLKQKPLPDDIQKWLDEATDGAVLLTFGTNVVLSDLPEKKLSILFKVLGELKQRVLIKWEKDDKSQLPKNVKAAKWLPQEAILMHKNVRLFIQHGGLGGVLESMTHKVPTIGIPFFGDQVGNIGRVVDEGWGLQISWANLNEDDLRHAIHEILNNPKYKNRVTEKSNIYLDRLKTPLETAVYWVEYVIRHHGAAHLYYQGQDLNWIQSNSLDVLGLLLVIIYVVFKVIKVFFKYLISLAFGRNKNKLKLM